MVEVVLKNKYMGCKDRIKKIEKTLRLRKAICHLYPLELEVEEYEEDLLSQVPSEISQDGNASFHVNEELSSEDIPDASPFNSSNPQEEENSLIEEENLDPCGADTCTKPNDTVLKWIQCESCEFWFHLACLNLSSNKDYKDVYFACGNCWGPKNVVDIEEEPGDPSVSEGESLNEVSDGECLNAVKNDLNVNNVNTDLSGSQPNNILETDGRFDNSVPVIFEPDILSNNGVVSARIHRKAAIDCRNLLIEKIKSGQLGKVRSR